jgi:hypothetical protein
MFFPLNQQGFVTAYLVTEKRETDFSSERTDSNQLRFEKYLRSVVAEHSICQPQEDIQLGGQSPLRTPWMYYYSFGNWFVDRSAFYPLLKKVELQAATVLNVKEEMETKCLLWSFAAIDLWVNGNYAGNIDKPVYKPIQRKTVPIKLEKGKNLLYIRLQNLGVRDTRTLFGIQFPPDIAGKIRVTLPDEKKTGRLMKLDRWLSSVKLEGTRLSCPSAAPAGAELVYDRKPVDFARRGDRFVHEKIGGLSSITLRKDIPNFQLCVKVSGQTLSRDFELQELIRVGYSGVVDPEKNRKRIYSRIASVQSIPRGENDRFAMYPVLARYYEGTQTEKDEEEIYHALDQIESRRDCSDFLTCALVRFMKLYPMGTKLAQRCREVLCHYRFWMDQNGADGMCFWSENHSLMFFVSAYLAGETYPDDRFPRAGQTGKELRAAAADHIRDWLKDACSNGFDEFHSGGYTPITFAALLNVVDFGDEEMSALATQATDRLLTDLAVQTFHGVSVAPQGRVYREVLYPYCQDIQSLVNLIDPEAPDRFSEWVIFLATSKYRIPEGLKSRMAQPLSITYRESNAVICVEKQEQYMLTSVQSPRTDGVERVWENIAAQPEAGPSDFRYVKSLNECFHGTTQFAPGVYGYQQHMWYAALENDTCVFVNHPGSTFDGSSMRPGYWFGNGIMPALKQEKNILAAIYQIPERHPVSFTHLYWPGVRFDRMKKTKNWIFGSKNGGFVGIWCSNALVPYDDVLSGCEYRAYGRNMAYVCVCADTKTCSTLEDFMEKCKNMKIFYQADLKFLQAGPVKLLYREYQNNTQYI